MLTPSTLDFSHVYSVKITQLVLTNLSKSTLTKHVYVSLAFYRMHGQTLVRCFDVTCNPSLPAWYVTLTIGVPIIAYDTLRTRDAPSWRCKMTESWHWKRKLWKCPDIEEKQKWFKFQSDSNFNAILDSVKKNKKLNIKYHKMFTRPLHSWYPSTQAMWLPQDWPRNQDRLGGDYGVQGWNLEGTEGTGWILANCQDPAWPFPHATKECSLTKKKKTCQSKCCILQMQSFVRQK